MHMIEAQEKESAKRWREHKALFMVCEVAEKILDLHHAAGDRHSKVMKDLEDALNDLDDARKE